MIIKPVTIKSSLEFVVIGPLGRSEDGILVKSSTLDIDLIGTANLIYHDQFMLYESKLDKDNKIQYCWSRSITISKRSTKLLFCYRKPVSKSKAKKEFLRDEMEIRNNKIKHEFDSFLENSIVELQKMSYDELNFKPSINEAKILWNISPLILACMLE